MNTICVGDTVRIVASEYFRNREGVVVRSRYTMQGTDLHDPRSSFAIHIDGEDYGNRTWEIFGRTGMHSNFHSGSLVQLGGCLLVELIREGRGKRKRKGLTAFLEEYS